MNAAAATKMYAEVARHGGSTPITQRSQRRTEENAEDAGGPPRRVNAEGRGGERVWARMRAIGAFCLALSLVVLGAWQVAPGSRQAGEPEVRAREQGGEGVRFTHYDVLIDSGGKSLGAWQVEVNFPSAEVKLVGVEGGEHAAYKDPPYYDPAALHNPRGARIILGAFNTGADLPGAKTRVARIHVQVSGGAPKFEVKLGAAADGAGEPVEATVALVAGGG